MEHEEDWGYSVTKERALSAGCCADDAWRGRFCQYHQGMQDGMDAIEHLLRSGVVDPGAIGMEPAESFHHLWETPS